MSKLSKQILTIAIALLAFGCSKTKTPNETSFAISGTIQGADSPYIILREIGKTGFTPADTIPLDKKGNFSHLVKMSEPTLYSLSYKDDYITLCPIVNVYINLHLKNCRLYVAMNHVNQGTGRAFWAPHYPINPRTFHFGLSWNFFN